MRLTLPLPPSVNRMYRAVRGKVLLSQEGRAYKDACALAAVAQLGVDPMEGRLILRADFHMNDRGDLDNRFKALLDALQGSAYYNDSQLVELHAKRHYAKAEHRVEVEIEEAA